MAFYKCARIYVTENSNTEINTASGAIANFDTDVVLPLIDIKAEIKAVETGTGAKSPSNPYVISGFTGANLYQSGDNLIVNNTLTNGYITNDGSITSNAGYKCTDYIELDENATNVIERFKTTQSNERLYRIAFYDSNKAFLEFGYSETIAYADFTATVTIPSGAKYIRACANISRELWFIGINGTTYPVSWQTEAGTVYGGEADITNGKVKVTHKGFDLGLLSWSLSSVSNKTFYGIVSDVVKTNGNSICSIYTSGDYTAWSTQDYIINLNFNNNLSLVRISDSRFVGYTREQIQSELSGVYAYCELATLIEVDITPQAITPFLGVNNIWNDTNGDTTIEYRNLTQGG